MLRTASDVLIYFQVGIMNLDQIIFANEMYYNNFTFLAGHPKKGNSIFKKQETVNILLAFYSSSFHRDTILFHTRTTIFCLNEQFYHIHQPFYLSYTFFLHFSIQFS